MRSEMWGVFVADRLEACFVENVAAEKYARKVGGKVAPIEMLWARH